MTTTTMLDERDAALSAANDLAEKLAATEKALEAARADLLALNDTGAPTADEASSNFYWTVGHTETFSVQTTIRGAISPTQIASHIKSALSAMHQVVAAGGHAKPVGSQATPPPPATTTPKTADPPNGGAQPAPAPAPAPTSGPTPAASEVWAAGVTLAHGKTQNGDDLLVAFCRKWQAWGAKIWPEVADSAPALTGWREWPLCPAGKAGYEKSSRYTMPVNLTADVLFENGKPVKVTAFR